MQGIKVTTTDILWTGISKFCKFIVQPPSILNYSFHLIKSTFFQKVLVNNPCPPVKREGAFEDTMFLIDLLKQSREKEIKEKKVCHLILLMCKNTDNMSKFSRDTKFLQIQRQISKSHKVLWAYSEFRLVFTCRWLMVLTNLVYP